MAMGHKEKVPMSSTIAVHVRDNSWYKAKCGYLWDVAVNTKMKDGNVNHNKTPYGDNGRGNTPFSTKKKNKNKKWDELKI